MPKGSTSSTSRQSDRADIAIAAARFLVMRSRTCSPSPLRGHPRSTINDAGAGRHAACSAFLPREALGETRHPGGTLSGHYPVPVGQALAAKKPGPRSTKPEAELPTVRAKASR
jgi:hypothetical protein